MGRKLGKPARQLLGVQYHHCPWRGSNFNSIKQYYRIPATGSYLARMGLRRRTCQHHFGVAALLERFSQGRSEAIVTVVRIPDRNKTDSPGQPAPELDIECLAQISSPSFWICSRV